MVVSLFYDVMMRYLFASPTNWALEVNTFLLLFVCTIPTADVLDSNVHIRVTFLTDRMRSFFRSLAVEAVRINLLKLIFLDVDDITTAAALCFDHNGTRYLYNSGYDAGFSHLSVGILCKILSIRDGIARGLVKYDFLKGEEAYKHRLGGRPVPIHRCRIELSGA